ncbi:MAG: hypothetical protein Q9197_006074 [Variospora fuerteventurae]
MLTILVLVGIAYFIYKFFIYPVYRSPLSTIPAAHITASWSPLWILWIRYTGVQVQTIHKAHLKHGPIVRLGPSDLSVNCVDGGIRTIYSGNFDKIDFYDVFENYGVQNMISTKGSKPHSMRKRMTSNVYTKAALQSSKDFYEITRSILYDRLLPVLASAAATRSAVEVHSLNHATTVDFTTSYIFGMGNDTNFIRDVERRTKDPTPDPDHPEHRRTAHSLQNDATPHAAKEQRTHPVVYTQLVESLDRSSMKPADSVQQQQAPNYRELRIASELLDHLIAGMDTSAVTLTYLLWEMSRNPDVQYELRKELRALSPTLVMENAPKIPPPQSMDALPLLHSIVMETLRRHTVTPSSQPRVTPSTPTSLAGSPPLPGGIRVSAQAYSLHRNEEVFRNSEVWDPKRWLHASAKEKEEMMRWLWAFGSGGTMCIARNFAMQELKYVTAAIYSNFTTTIIDDTGIEQKDDYMAHPKGEQLQLQFTRLEPEKGEEGNHLPPLRA